MKPKRKNNIRVIKDPIDPETPEVLAASIVKIGDTMGLLAGVGGLTDSAIVALICNMDGNSSLKKAEVHTVLDGLHRLKSYYIRSTPRSK